MGRRRKGGKGQGKPKNFNRGGGKVGAGYDLTARHNELFVKYYQGQGIVPEEEWDEFYATLKKTLPVTFRITGYKSQSQELLNHIKGQFFGSMLDVKVDGEEVPAPKCIPWYPNELAWQLDLTRKIVRSSEQFSRLHDFLVAETECGTISRQEAVSMIPPLVMDVKSHHTILDMCASPGSKTAQLIEYLHSSAPAGELPTGYVVANDSDNKRCYLMVHQVKRLQSPCFIIANHDGTIFPKIQINDDDSNLEYQYFDRILCDVPCSGDGTMRKNFDVWSKWHPLQGANMHGLQTKILKRGCQLLAKGGRLIYSTCSLNPIEDEAVIAEMLRMSEGALELVDVSDMLPGLKYTKGLSTWKVMTKTGEWIPSKTEIPAPMATQYKHTIFPPTEEEAKKYNLDRCIRILPHQQDSGGFFVAALRKVRHLPGSKEARKEAEQEAATAAATAELTSEKSEEAEKPASADEKTEPAASSDANNGSEVVTEKEKRKNPGPGAEPPAKKQKMFGYKEDPFLFMEESDPIWPQLRDFFGLRPDFPVNQILYRSKEGKRTLYFVSKSVRDIVRYNENRIRFINMGVKAFSRSPSPMVPDCDFRIAQECLGTLLPEVGKRVVKVNKKDAVTMISEENPYISKLSQETQDQLNALPAGSSVFIFTPSESEPSPSCEVAFCGWRGKTSVRSFSMRCYRTHQLMLFGEDIKAINQRVQEEKKAKAEAKAAQQAQGDANTESEGKAKGEDNDVEEIPKEVDDEVDDLAKEEALAEDGEGDEVMMEEEGEKDEVETKEDQ